MAQGEGEVHSKLQVHALQKVHSPLKLRGEQERKEVVPRVARSLEVRLAVVLADEALERSVLLEIAGRQGAQLLTHRSNVKGVGGMCKG